MVRVPTDRAPIHAGEILLEEFLTPMKLTQRDLADAIDVPYQRVNELVNGRRGVTPSTALRLAEFFGTTPGFWLNLQSRWDLYHTQTAEAEVLENIRRRADTASSSQAGWTPRHPPRQSRLSTPRSARRP
jgi:addiction module HigA family antidote